MNVTPYISQQPVDDFSLRFADLLYSAGALSGADTTLTIPGNAHRYKALMKVAGGTEMWVAINAVAAVPAGATFAATTSELIPPQGLCREVVSGDVLHFTSPAQFEPTPVDVSVVLYSVGTNN